MGRNLGNSFLILAIAIVILWLAVTDKLGNLLDAWKVAQGKEKVQPAGNTAAMSSNPIGSALASAASTVSSQGPATISLGAGGGNLLTLPTLPSLGTLHS
jgi:hypothetical protein